MTRTYVSLATVFALALAGGCAKKGDETQNPDGAGDGDSAIDSGQGDGDAAATSSRARGSTATRSGGRHTKARKVTAKKPPRAPVEPGGEDSGPNGLLVQAYQMKSGDTLATDFSGEVTESFEVPNLDFDEIDFTEGFPGGDSLKELYGLSFTGSINVVEEAEYELCLHSDDGSQLLLEDMLVVDNDGVHDEAVEACELVYLAPGEYMLEIRYFQAQGPLLTLHMAWAINGGDKVIIPTEVLFKPDSAGAGA